MDDIVKEYLPEAFAFIYVINSENAGGIQRDRVRHFKMRNAFSLQKFSKGNARVEIPASFFSSFGGKSQLSPHHACATF